MSAGFSEPHHLSKRRPAGDRFDPFRLPRQRRGVTPQLHGRYPDYDVLAEQDAWDEVTRSVVLARVESPPPLVYFGAAEAECLSAFCDVVLAQDAEPRVPVLAFIDAKLQAGRRDGYRYAGFPDDGELFRLLAAGLDEAARARAAESFARAGAEVQAAIVGELASGRLTGALWERHPPGRVWRVVARYALEAFYSHPWAWNEIGFGGPAYPRGYMRLGTGQREPWERDEAPGPSSAQDGAEGAQ